VEEDEGTLQPGDDQVLVVARVGDDRGAVRQAGQVLEEPAGPDQHLGRIVRHVVEHRAP
jgi:hypothetical protein